MLKVLVYSLSEPLLDFSREIVYCIQELEWYLSLVKKILLRKFYLSQPKSCINESEAHPVIDQPRIIQKRVRFIFGKLVRSMVNVAPDSMAISVLCIGVRALTETAPGIQFTGVSERQGIEEKDCLVD